MLKRKQELDQQNRLVNNLASDGHWIADALELLLRLELQRHSANPPPPRPRNPPGYGD